MKGPAEVCARSARSDRRSRTLNLLARHHSSISHILSEVVILGGEEEVGCGGARPKKDEAGRAMSLGFLC